MSWRTPKSAKDLGRWMVSCVFVSVTGPSFYPARGVCRLPEGVEASASGAVQWPVDIESRPREILMREILPRTPRVGRSGG